MPRVSIFSAVLLRRCFSQSRKMSVSATAQSWPKVVLFGDSITQFSFSSDGCWGALLTDHLQRKCDVLNRGFSGYNVRWCRHLLPQLVTKDMVKDIAALTIFLGANDSNGLELNPRQHVPLTEYRNGLNSMVEYLLSIGLSRDKIILISPPAFFAEEWEKELNKKGQPLSKDNETTAEYAKTCVAVAKECGTQVVDLYNEMMKIPDWESFLNDGLHLSSSGSRLLFTKLEPIIDKLTASVPVRFPSWDEVDLQDVKSSLVPFKH